MSIVDKIFDPNRRFLKRASKIVEHINELEEDVKKLNDSDFTNKTREFKERLSKGETLDDLLPEAFALVREASRRAIGMRPFDVQIIGAIALHEGKVAEMKTGEGKTLVAVMPAYLNALEGKGVHVVTVNDYLAKRDANWMKPAYELLGLSVGFLQSEMDQDQRRAQYNCDITYGTNTEMGFDYLRDNLAYLPEQRVQRGHNYAIIDEVDSILIDEARTPLIISGPAENSSRLYKQFASLAKKLKKDEDFKIDEKQRTVSLTEAGIKKIEDLLGIQNLYDPSNIEYNFHILNALRALHLYKKDVDYIVRGNEVVIVDEFTGRILEGRRYSEGLHQAIEAKENVQIKEESITYATITLQNYFLMYKKIAGMTGTAYTEREEFDQIYKMKVVVIPTNKPMIRKDMDDLIYRTEEEKYNAIIEEVTKRYQKGQPVLIGTTSIEKNEKLSAMLKRKGIPHEVLNAKNHEKEAEIIAKAGQKGSVTVATNMAGRGVDIKLGEGVVELGGLFVLGTERHESRRIDNQLRGRSGRQGDPGESRFYISTEDNLLRIFGGDRMKSLMNTLKIAPGQPIEHPMLSRLIEQAQKKVEGMHFSIRKHLLELDSVLDRQRNAVYSHRNWILDGTDVREHLTEIFEDVVDRRIQNYLSSKDPDEWDWESFSNELSSIFPFFSLDGKSKDDIEELKSQIMEDLKKNYDAKVSEIGEERFPQILKYVMLKVIDERWRLHLQEVDMLKESINLRAYGQKDPVIEFKKESYQRFEEMVDGMYDDISSIVFRIVMIDEQKEKERARKRFSVLQTQHSDFTLSNGKKDEKAEEAKKKRMRVKR
ncbi:MAG: preprotein translocase subunit SecA [Mesoaciditoga sp.]|uniref:preprotein translocase subunit SecA n=1 Tax=Athalassotoga sp. TaxID=2022597 RepID=UPI000CC1C2CF|nr:MAG: preprotein translocase subunit SecA [Mesoaciditoga sp.]PMP80458.1 MAG: preprotein translocase subunit SecA [Mesoaciditoga sp.]HEU24716.1 preprotein translocase subunit SecA [Mesoaciditoga lauensis]